MNNLSSLLGKFTKLLENHGFLSELIIEACKKEGVNLERGDCVVKEKIAYIQASPGAKNRIFMKKDAILKEINATKVVLLDIR